MEMYEFLQRLDEMAQKPTTDWEQIARLTVGLHSNYAIDISSIFYLCRSVALTDFAPQIPTVGDPVSRCGMPCRIVRRTTASTLKPVI